MKQLDLFKPEGMVVPFPVARQRQNVRAVVRALAACRKGAQRAREWQLIRKSFTASLEQMGVPRKVIAAEIAALRAAVAAERARQLVWGEPEDQAGGGGR